MAATAYQTSPRLDDLWTNVGGTLVYARTGPLDVAVPHPPIMLGSSNGELPSGR